MSNSIELLLDVASNALNNENYDVAIYNYQLASEKGSIYARISLAMMHNLGLGFPADAAVSEQILLEILENKNFEKKALALAAHNLSTLYYTGGDNLAPNSSNGFKFQNLAIQLGFPK